MPELSEPQKCALQILFKHGPLWPREFAKLMWPDSPGWQRMHKCGNHGASRGAMMAMVGGGYLGKLKKRGWVVKHWQRRWVGDRPLFAGYVITAKGCELAKELEDV